MKNFFNCFCSNKNIKFIATLIVVLILAVSGFTYVKLSTNIINVDGTITANWFDKQKIIKIAKQEVLKNIKTPSTAKFPDNKEIIVKVSQDDKNLYVVSMWVDAQNSYGAMLRENVVMQIILKSDDSYEIKDIMFL